MNKTFDTYRTTIVHKKNARRALKSRRRFKENKRKKNKALLGKTKSQKKQYAQPTLGYKYKTAKVPLDFSFLTNADSVVKFIANVKGCFVTRRPVFIEMKHVKLIDYSAIIVLLSIMIRFKSHGIPFNGDFPNDGRVNDIFLDSGFFDILYKDRIKNRDRYDLGKTNAIHTHAWKNVDPSLGPLIMANVSEKLLGRKVVYKGLQRTLIELMQNSFNHAEPSKEGEKHWWLSVNIDTQRKITSFSFIDYGVGIFESLNSKDEKSKWFNWKNLISIFNPQNNADILKLILEGKLHKSVTGQDYRGKGLPGIKEAMDRNLISKLFIITNDVFGNVSENIYVTLPNNFQGTFVYWEINDLTVGHPWTL